MKKPSISPRQRADGISGGSRFTTFTADLGMWFFTRNSETNHEPVDPTLVAIVFPIRSCGVRMPLRTVTM